MRRENNNEKRGRLIVISGPSGAGKSTVRKRVMDEMEGVVYSISATTRRPRPGEKDGKDYRFVSEDEFLRLRDFGLLLEWAKVHNNMYGTLKGDVDAALANGYDIILEIDVHGALQIRDKYPDAIMIFIMPPSEQELERRLLSRGTENMVEADVRLHNAQEEMRYAEQYDYDVVNDDLDRAVSEIESILTRDLKIRSDREDDRDAFRQPKG